MNDYTIVIPVRKGSKGLPFKNRKLLPKLLGSIPLNYKDKIIIATDDEEIIEKYEKEYKVFIRSESNCTDTASTKSVMLEVCSVVSTNNIIMLYTTYPERDFNKILDAINFFENNGAKSLLCRKELKVSPYLMMYSDGIHGKQIVSHDLYRRQDYPECFEISHFICIFNKNELNNLNNNIYNKDTIFYKIDSVIDVDTKEDLEKYNEKNKNNC